MNNKPNTQSSANASISTHFEALDDSLKALIEAVKQIRKNITTLQPLLDSTSTSTSVDQSDSQVSQPAPKKATNVATKVSSQEFLKAVNTLPIPELTEKLKKANAKRNVMKNIINERKQLNFHAFTSLDVLIIRIKGLAESSLEKIMDQWA